MTGWIDDRLGEVVRAALATTLAERRALAREAEVRALAAAGLVRVATYRRGEAPAYRFYAFAAETSRERRSRFLAARARRRFARPRRV